MHINPKSEVEILANGFRDAMKAIRV